MSCKYYHVYFKSISVNTITATEVVIEDDKRHNMIIVH